MRPGEGEDGGRRRTCREVVRSGLHPELMGAVALPGSSLDPLHRTDAAHALSGEVPGTGRGQAPRVQTPAVPVSPEETQVGARAREGLGPS